jgi:hypothetical protein
MSLEQAFELVNDAFGWIELTAEQDIAVEALGVIRAALAHAKRRDGVPEMIYGNNVLVDAGELLELNDAVIGVLRSVDLAALDEPEMRRLQLAYAGLRLPKSFSTKLGETK